MSNDNIARLISVLMFLLPFIGFMGWAKFKDHKTFDCIMKSIYATFILVAIAFYFAIGALMFVHGVPPQFE